MPKKESLHFLKKEILSGEINKMDNSEINNDVIKKLLSSSKTIAMVGVSSVKKEDSTNIKRRPSIIVMEYLQEFGYRVIPVNPSAEGKKINGEDVFARLKDIKVPIDVVNVFRPSNEAPFLANETIEIGAKAIWLQYGIQSKDAEKIANSSNITYIANRCIKQEYQRLFLKVNPVFPALKTN